MSRKDVWPLAAIGFILAVTAGWWTLALWSVPGAPEWLERTRAVCFNLTESGLPDAKGWLLLIGQPPTMLTFLLVGWHDEVRASVRRLLSSAAGQAVTVMILSLAVAGVVLAGATVRGARLPRVTFGADEPAPETYPRLDRAWPESAGLVDQRGEPFGSGRLAGRPALVTFAFGNCATLCPAIVHVARATRLEARPELPIVVYTLDPWRDTPGRLGALLGQFELDEARDFLVGGSVEEVERALDAWGIPRSRDLKTGDITHPAIVYLIDSDGTVAYASTGGVAQMASLAQRLR